MLTRHSKYSAMLSKIHSIIYYYVDYIDPEVCYCEEVNIL